MRIKKKKLYEEVIAGIEEMLRSNSLKPGDRMQSERELALYFGVSKTAVREALSALQTAGVIEVRHGSGIYVRDVNEKLTHPLTLKILAQRESLLDILELRRGLETEGAYLAAERADADDIARIKESLIAMADNMERDGAGSAEDCLFHKALIRAAHNEAYGRVYDSIADIFRDGMTACHECLRLDTGRRQAVLEEHRLIYEAVKKRQPEKARELMRLHLDNSSDSLRQLPP